MASLRVPDSGLQLESSGSPGQAAPNQAFALTLSNNVIEDMIKCVQNDGEIQLSLGSTPVSAMSPRSASASHCLAEASLCPADTDLPDLHVRLSLTHADTDTELVSSRPLLDETL